MKNTFLRRRRPRRIADRFSTLLAEEARHGLRLESLEHRLMLHGEGGPEHDLTEHVHHELSIFVDGEQVAFPLGFGTDASGNILANPHNHGGDERLHVHPIDGSTPTEFATIGDFFDVWRTNAGVVGNNPDAVFSSQQILGNFADATHVVRMFVNGELNDEFQNYEMHDGDDIVIRYDAIENANSSVFADLTNPVVTLNTNLGSIQIELFKNDTTGATATPITVDNFLTYVTDGDFIESFFHRYVPGFIVQGGGFTTTQLIPDAFDQINNPVPTDPTITNEPFNSNILGTVAMAKLGGDPDSATSQFFFNLGDNSGNLDAQNGGFTAFGRVLNVGSVNDILAGLTTANVGGAFTDLPLTANGELFVIQSIDSNVTLNGTKFNDINLNGVRDVGEQGLADFVIYIDENENQALDPGEISTVTDSNGDYRLEAPFGDLTIREVPNPDFLQTFPTGSGSHSVSITADELGSDIFDLDFGNARLPAPLSVDLLAGSDSGRADDDDLTNLTVLDFRVEGVTDGAVVTLLSGDTPIASATATGTSVIVTGNVGAFSGNVHSISATQSLSAVESDRSPALVVTIDRDPGGFTTSAPLTVNIGDNYLYNVGHDDEVVGQQNVAYSLDTFPDDMTIDINTGQIIWLGVAQTVGTHDVVVEATDLAGNVATQPFTLTVNGPPVMDTIGDKTADEDEQLSFTITADDPNSGDTLTFSLSGDSNAPTLGSTSGIFTWTPGELDGGRTFDFTVTVTDAGGLFDSTSFQVTVDEVNLPPQLAVIGDKTAFRGQVLSFSVEGTDPDVPTQTLVYTLLSPPLGASIDLNSGEFSWTPSAEQADAEFEITVRVADSKGLFADQSFTVIVQDVPEPPQFDEFDPPTEDEGNLVELTVTATDPNLPSDELSYKLISGPDGATINAETGEFRWQTDEADGPGTFDVTVEVRDLTDLFDLLTFTITVDEVNLPPTFDAQIVDQIITEGDPLSLNAQASDPDLPVQNLTYSLINPPSGATIDNAGQINWTPAADQALRDHDFQVRVSDGEKSTEQTFTVTVEERAKAPVLSPIADRSVDEGEVINVVAQATDPNGDEANLRFSLAEGAPDGATIDPVSGEFSWTPGETDGPGEHVVTIIVTDSDSLTDETSFTITVEEVNQQPVLAPIADRQVMEDQIIDFEAAADDDDKPDQELRYSLASNAPEGATIDEISGQFHWTPPPGSAGEYLITVRVTDDATSSLSDSQSFHVTVEAAPIVLPGFAAAQTLALRSTQSRFVGPLPPVRPTPIVLPALVNRVQNGATFTPSLTEAFREFANIGSGGIHARQGTTSGDGEGPSDKKPTDQDAEPDSLKKKPGLDEEAGIPVDEGVSRQAVDEAIAGLLAETAAAV